jgi:hypothetical protein
MQGALRRVKASAAKLVPENPDAEKITDNFLNKKRERRYYNEFKSPGSNYAGIEHFKER